MPILISIKPHFARAILDGNKRFEFRRKGFATQPDCAVIYATSPEQHIIGWFEVAGVIEDTPEALWKKCGRYGGIDREAFMAYYEGCETGYAIKVGSTYELATPLRLDELPEPVVAPQSFRNLAPETLDEIAGVLA